MGEPEKFYLQVPEKKLGKIPLNNGKQFSLDTYFFFL